MNDTQNYAQCGSGSTKDEDKATVSNSIPQCLDKRSHLKICREASYCEELIMVPDIRRQMVLSKS